MIVSHANSRQSLIRNNPFTRFLLFPINCITTSKSNPKYNLTQIHGCHHFLGPFSFEIKEYKGAFDRGLVCLNVDGYFCSWVWTTVFEGLSRLVLVSIWFLAFSCSYHASRVMFFHLVLYGFPWTRLLLLLLFSVA